MGKSENVGVVAGLFAFAAVLDVAAKALERARADGFSNSVVSLIDNPRPDILAEINAAELEAYKAVEAIEARARKLRALARAEAAKLEVRS